MSRTLFSQARTGKRARSGNFTNVGELEWEVGKSNRVVIPIYEDKEGNRGVAIFSQTIHRLEYGLLQLPKRRGGTYSTHTFRCSHPFSQQNHNEAVKIAKSQEMCVLCEYEKLQNSRRMGIMEQEYGTEEENFEDWGENFKALDREDKKEFFQKHPISVEKSYYEKEDGNGDKYNVQTTETFMLLYDIEVEEVKKKRKIPKTGKTVTITESQPVLDAEGKVKYKPVLFKVSEKRLSMFKDAIDNALASETISYENIHTYVENEGTEVEEEVNVGWVDFELKYPKKEGKTKRMDSAKDLQILATVDSKSILLLNEGLLEDMQENIQKDYASAKGSFENVYKNLQLYTRDEQLALLSPEARGEFEQLREEFRTEEDEKFEQSVYERVLEQGKEKKEEKEEQEDDSEKETKSESTKKSKSKTSKGKTSKGASTKKATKAKKEEELEEEPEETDEDIDLDDNELFPD